MFVTHDVSLAARTTLGLGGSARRLLRVEALGDLQEALALAAGEPVLVLGGGSNLVVRDGGFAGTVIEMAIPGVTITADGDTAIVSAFAGVEWDALVAQLVDAGLAGVESMSGIPGRVGATPMQNVGAYGQEVADTIELVRVLDRQTGEIERFEPADCGFAYRTSVFKGSAQWIVVEVRFRLRRSTLSAPIRYPELARALGVAPGEGAPLAEVRRTVIELRRGKGMVVDADDPDSRSAGSFFMNPIVDAPMLAAIEARVPAGVTMPTFPAPAGHTKLSAGWLIERAGFVKGTTRGRVGISSKHALALINRGGATTTELLALAREIQDGVRARFGVDLVPEPVIVGAD
ncbi:MAG: UDP-N-acetylmuramate dehydrogenase [Deltaproteobacteria bacterium]|nr:UDP-N-acetylmuramate dehydrogenase [Deltaproteobacteria bacterium]